MFEGQSSWDKVEHRETVTSATIPWNSMAVEDLLAYREQVLSALKTKIPLSVTEMDVETELLIQLQVVRQLQSDVIEANDETVPLNQKVALINSVTDTLARIVTLQEKIYNSERFKTIEMALIRVMDKLPEQASKEFLEEYEKILSTVKK